MLHALTVRQPKQKLGVRAETSLDLSTNTVVSHVSHAHTQKPTNSVRCNK